MVLLRTLLISSLLSLPLALRAEGPAPLPFDDPNYNPPAVTPQPLAPAGDASNDKPDCKTVMVKKSRRAKPVPVTRCSKPARTAEQPEARAEEGERHCKTVMVKKSRRSKAVAETRCSGSSSRTTAARSEQGKHEVAASSRTKKGKAAAQGARSSKSDQTEKTSKRKIATQVASSKKKRH